MAGLRAGLLSEILVMAVDTLRANKMRSALTILGVVIGITSIVSMTALIRGFDESFKDLFRQVGPSTMFIQKFGFVSFSQGKQFRDVRWRRTGGAAVANQRYTMSQRATSDAGRGTTCAWSGWRSGRSSS